MLSGVGFSTLDDGPTGWGKSPRILTIPSVIFTPFSSLVADEDQMASDFVRISTRFLYLLANLIGLVWIPGEPCQCFPQPRYSSLEHHRREVRL